MSHEKECEGQRGQMRLPPDRQEAGQAQPCRREEGEQGEEERTPPPHPCHDALTGGSGKQKDRTMSFCKKEKTPKGRERLIYQ